jgi:hypothetical protein
MSWDHDMIQQFYSINNSFIDEERGHGGGYQLEFFNLLLPKGFPPYELFLQMGVPIILLRNLAL